MNYGFCSNLPRISQFNYDKWITWLYKSDNNWFLRYLYCTLFIEKQYCMNISQLHIWSLHIKYISLLSSNLYNFDQIIINIFVNEQKLVVVLGPPPTLALPSKSSFRSVHISRNQLFPLQETYCLFLRPTTGAYCLFFWPL